MSQAHEKIEVNKDYYTSLPDFPPHMTPIGTFTALRTYSRYLQKEGRREVWKEVTKRAAEYSVGLEVKHRKKLNLPIDWKKLNEEVLRLFKNMYNLRQAVSGRTLWVGGADTGVAEKFPLANFNCSFTNIGNPYEPSKNWDDLAELFYLLLVGTGVGFKILPRMAKNLPALRNDFTLVHDEYEPLPPWLRAEKTELFSYHTDRYDKNQFRPFQTLEDNFDEMELDNAILIRVGDSKEGWVDALRLFFEILSKPSYDWVQEIRFNYDSVRPAGERLKTFGGTASGPEPLREMFDLFFDVIHEKLDPSLDPLERVGENRVRLRPVHIIDMANGIGKNVVVGGVRRTSEIAIFSGDPGEIDWESLYMKLGINGIFGDTKEEAEARFAHLEAIRRYATENNFPLPNFFDELATKYYDVLWQDENGETQKATFTNENEAVAFAEEKGVEDYIPIPYNTTRQYLDHRRMSNNSMAFHTPHPPNERLLGLVKLIMQFEGEPGFINLYTAAKRRLGAIGIIDPEIITEHAYMIGLNPCAEIILYSKGVCNLTTVNVRAFVYHENGKARLDLNGLIEAQQLSARAGLRMTLATLELPAWNEVQQRDRLLGMSLTGWQDAMSELGYSVTQQERLLRILRDVAHTTANKYADELRVNRPLLVTTIKPEGTLSVVFGAVSSGLHVSHAPYYLRRIRINALDPLAKTVLHLKGWKVYAEVGTDNKYTEKELAKPEVIAKAKTLVIDFPVKSGAKKTKAETLVDEQFDTYFMFQRHYVDHNASITVHIQEKYSEWDRAMERIYEGWNHFVGVSFISLDNNTYTLTPYETIDEKTYEERWNAMEPFDFEKLKKFDRPIADDSSLEGMADCDSGACAIR